MELHLYLPSGEFLCERNVYGFDSVDHFAQSLEEDLITQDLDSADDGDDGRDYLYILVWKGFILGNGRKFADLVRDHGMSETEPICITVIKFDPGSP